MLNSVIITTIVILIIVVVVIIIHVVIILIIVAILIRFVIMCHHFRLKNLILARVYLLLIIMVHPMVFPLQAWIFLQTTVPPLIFPFPIIFLLPLVLMVRIIKMFLAFYKMYQNQDQCTKYLKLIKMEFDHIDHRFSIL